MAILLKIKNYFLDSVAEMRKVIWPTRRQTTIYTILVIIMSVGMAFFFAALDYVFNLGLGAILNR